MHLWLTPTRFNMKIHEVKPSNTQDRATTVGKYKPNISGSIDDLHVRLTFNLGKTNTIFYYSQKEHPKFSRIAKFGGEIL